MGLKSAQAWGCPMLHEMSIQRLKVSSHPFSPPSLYSCLYKKQFLKISRLIKTCSTNGRDLPHSTLPFVVGMDSWLRSWHRDKVTTPDKGPVYTMFFPWTQSQQDSLFGEGVFYFEPGNPRGRVHQQHPDQHSLQRSERHTAWTEPEN